VESLTGVEVHDVAVTSADGAVDFHPATQAWISSLRDRADGSTPIRVRGQSLDSLLDELDIPSVDLLKIDVEGEELAVLGASTRLGDIRAIVGELHDPAQLHGLRELLSDYEVELRNVTDDHIAFSAVRTGQDARRTR
jgi:methyltransferase FkbM-like protein